MSPKLKMFFFFKITFMTLKLPKMIMSHKCLKSQFSAHHKLLSVYYNGG